MIFRTVKKEYAYFRAQIPSEYLGTKIGCASQVFLQIFFKIVSDSLIGAAPICGVIGYFSSTYLQYSMYKLNKMYLFTKCYTFHHSSLKCSTPFWGEKAPAAQTTQIIPVPYLMSILLLSLFKTTKL